MIYEEDSIQEINTSNVLTGGVKSPLDIPDEDRSWIRGLIKREPLSVFRRSVPFGSFSGGSTTFDLTVFTLPAYCEIVSAWMHVRTAFAGGGGLSSCTISVGPDGTETTLLTAQSATTTGLKKSIGTDLTSSRAIYSLTGGTNIQARVTCNVNTSNLNAGAVEFAFTYIDYTAT